MSDSLDDLPFIDLYVRIDQPDQAYFRSLDRTQNTISQLVPPEFQVTIDRLAAAVGQKLKEHNEGALTFDGVRLRLARQKLSDGSQWFCARRVNTVVPDIEKLGLPPLVINHMMGLGKRDGLVLISGSTAQGKTTTGVSLLSYYLKNYGGTAVTIEDPCEYVLAGRHGTGGQCFQIEVENDDDWAICLKRSLRWSPHYIYVGEIRTAKAAEQVLRAATTGHLVITTVHAGAIEEALMAIIFMAEQAMGSGAYNMLATGITALVNQSLGEPGKAGATMRYVYTEENAPGDPVRSLIREGKIGMLSTYIDRAAARLQTASAQFGGAAGGKK